MKNNKNRINLHLALAVACSAFIAPAFGMKGLYSALNILDLKPNKFNLNKEEMAKQTNVFNNVILKNCILQTTKPTTNTDKLKNDINNFSSVFKSDKLIELSKSNAKTKDDSFYDYDLDDAVEDLLYTEPTSKLQNIIRGNQERQKIEQYKKSLQPLQNIMRVSIEQKKLKKDKHGSSILQNIIAGTNARKKMLENKKNQISSINNLNNSFLDESFFKINEDDKNATEKLKKCGSDFNESFEQQVKAMVTNLATSVGKENDTDTITTKTKQLIKDIKEGARIVYGANFKENFNIVTENEKNNVNRYIQIVQQVCSYYYYINAQQRSDNIGFQEGTFFIEYTSLSKERWNKFFENLAVAKQIMQRPSAYYQRISSHDFGAKSYGMDFRKHEDAYIEWLYRFKTMLISETDHGIWIKPEHYGCYYWKDKLEHLKGWYASQTGKFANSDYYNQLEWNKERTPDEVIQEFKKLFPEYKGQMNLSAFYKHANNNKQQAFAKKLKQTYSNIMHRHGRECYIDYARLAESCFLAHSDNQKLLGFYKHIQTLQKHISSIQCGESNNKILALIRECIAHLKQNLFVLDETGMVGIFTEPLLSSSIKEYFTNTIKVVEKILDDKNGLTTLQDEPIFEIEFQKDFLVSAKEREQKVQKLKDEAQEINNNKPEKMVIAQELTSVIEKFCNRTQDALEKLNNFETIKNNIDKAPVIKSKDTKVLKNYFTRKNDLSLKDQDGVSNLLMSIEENYDKELFEATHKLTDDVIGLPKTRELSPFGYNHANPYVTSYNFIRMDIMNKVLDAIYKYAWAAQDNTAKNAVLTTYADILKDWQNTIQLLFDVLENYGYVYTSAPNGKGHKIMQEMITSEAHKKSLETCINVYKEKKNLFHKTIEISALSDNNKKRFIDHYDKLFKKFTETIDENNKNIVESLHLMIVAIKNESEFRKTIQLTLDASIRSIDWQYGGNAASTDLKFFHETILKEIVKEENKNNLNQSFFGNNLINN